MITMVTITGVSLPNPVDYSVSIFDISESIRTASARFVGELIATKRKIELTYGVLSASEMSTMLSLFASGSGNMLVSVTYIDPVVGGNRTSNFYPGDRNIPALDMLGGVIRWKGAKFNLIEE